MTLKYSTVRLRDLCEEYKRDIVDGPFGSNLKREHYKDSGIPVLKIQNIKPFNILLKKMDFVDENKYRELERHSYTTGDIIMTKLGSPLGVSAIVENIDDGLIVADLVRIRAKKIDTKYLCYHLNSPQTSAYINSHQKGTTRPRVRISVARDLPILVPPINEQQRIVKILDKTFADIERARKNTERNLQNTRELFDSYLNQIFIKVDQTSKKQALGDICERVSVGHVGSTSKYYCGPDEGIIFLRSQNVRPFHISYEGIKYIKKDFHEKLKKSQLKENDLLFVRVGANRGDCCAIRDIEGKINCANIVFARPIGHSTSYLEFFCNSSIGRKLLLGMTTGSAQGVINTKSVSQLKIPLPTYVKQLEIVSLISNFKNKIESLKANYLKRIVALDELKISILQKAFNGELTNKDTEEVMRETI